MRLGGRIVLHSPADSESQARRAWPACPHNRATGHCQLPFGRVVAARFMLLCFDVHVGVLFQVKCGIYCSIWNWQGFPAADHKE